MKFVPKTRMRRYQADALAKAFQNRGRYGLFLQPGTGKTKIAIDFMAASFLQKKANVFFVICQLTGHTVWKSELRKHCAVEYDLRVLLGSSRTRVTTLRKLRARENRLTIILLNYESTWRIEEAIVRLCWRQKKMPGFIYDEGHKLKNRSAKQSKCAHRLVQALDPYRLLLTGTHIANSPLDVFSEYMTIDDSIFGRRWKPFADRYASFTGFYGQQVTYRNLPDLRRKARQRATVLTKEECLALPGVIPIIKEVELSAKTRAYYQQMVEEFIAEDEDGDTSSAAIKLTQVMRLHQITGGFVTIDKREHTVKQIGREKLQALEAILEELIESGEKVVVFARFVPEIEAIQTICRRRRWTSYLYYGKNKKTRDVGYHAFKRIKKPSIFIGQTATASLSIDLTESSNAVFYSFDQSLINWQQCHDRLDRSGQTKKVTYYYLVANKTKDREILTSLNAKKKISTLLNNKTLAQFLLDSD